MTGEYNSVWSKAENEDVQGNIIVWREVGNEDVGRTWGIELCLELGRE